MLPVRLLSLTAAAAVPAAVKLVEEREPPGGLVPPLDLIEVLAPERSLALVLLTALRGVVPQHQQGPRHCKICEGASTGPSAGTAVGVYSCCLASQCLRIAAALCPTPAHVGTIRCELDARACEVLVLAPLSHRHAQSAVETRSGDGCHE
eukprot:4949778-Prymnesium_polylepis.1